MRAAIFFLLSIFFLWTPSRAEALPQPPPVFPVVPVDECDPLLIGGYFPYAECVAGIATADAIAPVWYAGTLVVGAWNSLASANEQAATTQGNTTAQATASTVTANAQINNAERLGAQHLPTGACDAVYLAGSVGALLTETNASDVAVDSYLEAYNRSIPATGMILSLVEMQTPKDLSPLAIFGTGDIGGSVLPTNKYGKQFIVDATNPIPERPIPANQLGGPLAAQKLAKYDQDQADVALAQNALAQIMAMREPLGGQQLAQWQYGLYSTLGYQPVGNPLGPTTNGVSLMSVLGAQVLETFANPYYYTSINASSAIKAWKSIANNAVLMSEMRYLILVTRQKNAAMEAVILGRMASIKGEAQVFLYHKP